MSKTGTKERVSLFNLKAAMVLAFNGEDEKHCWWDGVVNDTNGNPVVVLQVPTKIADDVHMLLRTYDGGFNKIERIDGDQTLWAIPADRLEHDLPKRVTRTNYGDDASIHYAWKKEVTARLDLIGCAHLTMEFSGAGDSANDDEWTASRTASTWYPKTWDEDGGRFWHKASGFELPKDLADLISEYVWETLVTCDIINNDGGNGTLEIDLSGDEPVFTLDVNQNEMVTHSIAHEEV